MPTFPQETIDGVLAHMNNDHTDDNLLIARAFGREDARGSRMTTLDSAGGTWVYVAAGAEHELFVPWSAPIAERPEIRREVVRLYDLACEKLGIEPRAH